MAQMDKANKLFESEHYSDAARFYQKMLEKGDKNQEAATKLGLCYRELRNYQAEEEAFAQAVQYDTVPAEVHLYYGQALKRNHKLSEARDQFKLFNQKEPGNFIGKLLIQSTELVYAWENEPTRYQIRTLENINSERSEICPVLFKDGLVITTNREDDFLNESVSSRDALPYYAVYYAPFLEGDSDRLSFEEPEAFSGTLNSDYNDGPVTFTENGSTIYFSRVQKSERGKSFRNQIKIYAGYLSGKRVKVKEPFYLNSNEYSVAHPFLSPDGSKLYFASDMPGGFGGYDIYFCTKEGEAWSAPINMGKGINTKKSEVYPSIAPNEDLYFSSSGHSGYGGLDLFVSKASNNYKTSENLRAPINSFTDDFGLAFVSEDRGYFSSDRPGGKGMDDIYAFDKLPPPPKEYTSTYAGVLEMDFEPVPDILLQLIDESNAIVRTTSTDTAGRFAFNYLAKDEDYRIEMVDASTEVQANSQIYLLNEQDKKVAIADNPDEGEFTFRALSRDELSDLAVLEEDDVELGRFELFGQIYTRLPGDQAENIEVVALDDDGNIVARTYTDANGKFEFKELARDKHYLFKISEDDPSLAIELKTRDEGGEVNQEVVNQDNQNFIFRKVSLFDSNEVALTSGDDDSLLVAGTFEYENLPSEGVVIQLVDENDNVIETVVTDERGRFKFKKLSSDKSYMVRVAEQDGDPIEDSGLLVLNEDNGKTKVITTDELKEGLFVYRKLSREEADALGQLTAQDDSVLISGILEDNEVPKSFVTLHLVDENNNIIETVVTDSKGSFKFRKLATDANYMITVDEEDAELLSTGEIILSNESGDKTLKTEQASKGAFLFRTLANETVTDIGTLEELDQAPEAQGVFGQLYKKLPGDYKEGMEVYALNDKGEILDVAVTDAQGNFEFKKLSRDDQVFFQLKDEEDDVTLVIVESEEELDAGTQRSLEGQFVYEKLNGQRSRIRILNEEDGELIGAPKLAQQEEDDVEIMVPEGPVEEDKLIRTAEAANYEILTIYYSFNSTSITDKAGSELEKVIAYLKEHPNVRLEIASHTDAKGRMDYNTLLSKRRTYATIQYITLRGISPERIKGYWYGATRTVNDCGVGVWCPLEEHAKNRRTEFKLISRGKHLENLRL